MIAAHPITASPTLAEVETYLTLALENDPAAGLASAFAWLDPISLNPEMGALMWDGYGEETFSAQHILRDHFPHLYVDAIQLEREMDDPTQYDQHLLETLANEAPIDSDYLYDLEMIASGYIPPEWMGFCGREADEFEDMAGHEIYAAILDSLPDEQGYKVVDALYNSLVVQRNTVHECLGALILWLTCSSGNSLFDYSPYDEWNGDYPNFDDLGYAWMVYNEAHDLIDMAMLARDMLMDDPLLLHNLICNISQAKTWIEQEEELLPDDLEWLNYTGTNCQRRTPTQDESALLHAWRGAPDEVHAILRQPVRRG